MYAAEDLKQKIRQEKVEHNDEIYEKLKNSTSGILGDLFIDNHFVLRNMRG